jgi:hypothetical protein
VTSSPAADALPVTATALAEGVIQMMWLARLIPLIAVAAALTLATAGVVVQGRQQPAPEGAQAQVKPVPPPTVGSGAIAVPDLPANQALARKQLALIDETWPFLMVLATNHRIDISSGILGQWGRRRLEALHKAGAGKAEIVTALVKYIKDLRELEVIAKEQLERALVNRLSVAEMQFLRMEAQIWLNEEKAR